ncbi:MAG: lectin [Casimicrobiaceae bacterium]
MPVLAVLTLMLCACNADRTPANDAATPPVDHQPAQDVPPATGPTDSTPPVAGDARFDGYSELRFGMTADEAKKAWDSELSGDPAESEGCYHLSPKSAKTPSEFAFMFENDKFVRYSTDSDKHVAPGGGKVGMSTEQIRQLYSGVEEDSHKYVHGGKYLRMKDQASNGVVLFETDAAGKVTEWRVGLPPQVDFVEGCS